MKKLSFLNRLVYYLTILSSLALLVACIVPSTNSATLAFFSLGVPVLVGINAFLALYWLLRKKLLILLVPFGALAYGYVALGTFIKLWSEEFASGKQEHISLMSFNSLGFRGKKDEWQTTDGDSILKFIREEEPDIISFQEFDYRQIRSDHFDAYPYNFVDFIFGEDTGRVVLAIYSKYNIIDHGILEFPHSSNSAIYADIVCKKDTLRIYNVHLESLNIRPGNLKQERSDRLFARLRSSFQKQQQQSLIVREHADASPYKTIISGDFNNNQFSSVYFNLKGDLKDTFMEKGVGYGATIDFWKFPFRIDFILVDPSFDVVSHQNYDIDLSDHEPIMASIKVSGDK